MPARLRLLRTASRQDRSNPCCRSTFSRNVGRPRFARNWQGNQDCYRHDGGVFASPQIAPLPRSLPACFLAQPESTENPRQVEGKPKRNRVPSKNGDKPHIDWSKALEAVVQCQVIGLAETSTVTQTRVSGVPDLKAQLSQAHRCVKIGGPPPPKWWLSFWFRFKPHQPQNTFNTYVQTYIWSRVSRPSEAKLLGSQMHEKRLNERVSPIASRDDFPVNTKHHTSCPTLTSSNPAKRSN